MAKKDETVFERVEHIGRSIDRVSRHVNQELDRLQDLEKHLPRDEAVIALFRLHISTIRMEMDYLKC